MTITRKFLEALLPPESTYAYGTIALPQTSACTNCFKYTQLDDVLQIIGSDSSLYFALASFRPDTATRKKSDVLASKTLIIDIDGNKQGGSRSTMPEDTAQDLLAFLESTDCPPTSVVATGGGLHCYWALDRVLDVVSWEQAALGFITHWQSVFANIPKHLTHQVHVDWGVSRNIACWGRMPNTANYKYPLGQGGYRQVEILTLDASRTYDPSRFHTAQSLPLTSDNSFAPVSKSSSNTPDITYYFEDLLQQCPTLAHMRRTGGQDYSEPAWRAGLVIASNCKDGDSYIHKLSRSHPTYDKADTEKKYASVRGQKPLLCATLDDYCGSLSKCGSCAHRGVEKAVSPFKFTKLRLCEYETVPDLGTTTLPPDYELSESGGLMRYNRKEEDFEHLPIPFTPLAAEAWSEHPSTGLESTATFTFTQGGKAAHRVDVPLSALGTTGKARLAKAFAQSGLSLGIGRVEILGDFMQSWHQHIMAHGRVHQRPRRYGWEMGTSGYTFALGGRVIGDGGDVRKIRVGALDNVFSVAGTLDEWKRDAQTLINNATPTQLLSFALSMAAPLVKFCPDRPAAVWLHSEASGAGKTMGQHLGASIWGRPEDMMLYANDTINAVNKRCGVYNSLPLFWDDVRLNVDDQRQCYDITQQILQFTHGKERQRLTVKAEGGVDFDAAGSWDTTICWSSNLSLEAIIKQAPHAAGKQAEFARILQIGAVSPFKGTADTARAAKSIRNENYGSAGEVYAMWLASNYDRVSKHVMDVYDSLSFMASKYGEVSRFIRNLVAVVKVGLEYAVGLGLITVPKKTEAQMWDTMTRCMDRTFAHIEEVSDQVAMETKHWALMEMIRYLNEGRGRTTFFCRDEVGAPKSLPSRNTSPSVFGSFLQGGHLAKGEDTTVASVILIDNHYAVNLTSFTGWADKKCKGQYSSKDIVKSLRQKYKTTRSLQLSIVEVLGAAFTSVSTLYMMIPCEEMDEISTNMFGGPVKTPEEEVALNG